MMPKLAGLFPVLRTCLLGALWLGSLARGEDCPPDAAAAGSSMGQWMCGSGGGLNANGSGDTYFLPPKKLSKVKRLDFALELQNQSFIPPEYRYQVSPYFKPAAVLRGCTGSIVTTYDTADANLDGRGQTVVSQRQCSSDGPIRMVSGLGNVVQVLQEDIYFPGGVIHITDE